MSRSFWDISYWDTGAGIWQKDIKIPRAGLETSSRLLEGNIEFLSLADGSEVKLSAETKANWQEITLVFPKQIVTESVKSQLISYIDNERGIKIPIPILTGSSSYTEKIIEGYPTKYEESWELDSRSNIHNIIRLTIKEFSVDGT